MRGRRKPRLFVALFIVLIGSAAPGACSGAWAAPITESSELLRINANGSAAGDLGWVRSIATDPRTGQIVVGQTGSSVTSPNARISEFTPWGEFVKAFGWNVAPGAVNELQELRVAASSAMIRFSLGADRTSAVPFDSSAALVQAELESLPSIGAGDVAVRSIPGSPGTTPFIFRITFKGALAASDVGQTTAEVAEGAADITARTLANGASSGSGLEACTAESGCQGGEEGAQPGELENTRTGLAIDAAGNIYVREISNNRVQKFDSAGRFLLMFGSGVDHTTGADVCTAEDVEVRHDVCGAGMSGTGPGEISPSTAAVAIASGGSLIVPDQEGLEFFSPDGLFEREAPTPNRAIEAVAVSPTTGHIFGTDSVGKELVEFSSTGTAETFCAIPNGSELALGSSLGLDGEDHVFGQFTQPFPAGEIVRQFSSACADESSFAEGEVISEAGNHRFELWSLATNEGGDLAVAESGKNPAGERFGLVRVYGPAPLKYEGAPPQPPTIVSQSASTVTSSGAVVGASINPHFATDTHVFVEYGLSACDAGGCTQPPSSGELLTPQSTGETIRSAGIQLNGLQPASTYHFRIIASSSGGGPVRGVGGVVGTDGAEGTFNTLSAPMAARTDCPNQAFRTGLSALLPDCRAYEMVSPINKNGGDIESLGNDLSFHTALSRSSTDGNRMTYSSYVSFGAPSSAAYTNQYLATRSPTAGWESASVTAPIGPALQKFIYLEGQTRIFSSDLCSSWLVTAPGSPIAPGAPEGFLSLYRRSNCGPVSYESLVTGQPPATREDFTPEVQGVTADGSEAVFRVRAALTSQVPNGVVQAYVAERGHLQPVCVLPDGSAWGDACSAGSAPSAQTWPLQNRYGSVTNALSSDGSRLYWTASHEHFQVSIPEGALKNGAGQVYLRENPSAGQSAFGSNGECTEPDMACTVPVSGSVTTDAAHFIGATPDGSGALFVVTEGPKDGTLYRYEDGAGARQIATKVVGVAGFSENLSRVYFISEGKVAGQGVTGKPNLALDEDGEKTFIATLSANDAEAQGRNVSDANAAPAYHASQASPDGSALAFISDLPLTGYDNTDATSSLPCGTKEGSHEGVCDSEVYLFRVGDEAPRCISCSPSGSQPRGRSIPSVGSEAFSLPTAASLPVAAFQLAVPRALDSDGTRLFFDSYDSLVPRDQNGKEDVYEWMAARSEQQCGEAGAELYVPAAEGCLSLISSGENSLDSEFLDSSPSGQDIFFTTAQSLLAQDPGQIDIYDARSGGGFPPSPATPSHCEEEACQPSSGSPASATPSSSVRGPGNPKSTSCRKHRGHNKRGKRLCQKTHRKRAHKKKSKHAHKPAARGPHSAQHGRRASR
jgi:hypothetical protein